MTELARLMRDYLRDDARTPLGAGMPSGGPLRADGQSHYEAWAHDQASRAPVA